MPLDEPLAGVGWSASFGPSLCLQQGPTRANCGLGRAFEFIAAVHSVNPTLRPIFPPFAPFPSPPSANALRVGPVSVAVVLRQEPFLAVDQKMEVDRKHYRQQQQDDPSHLKIHADHLQREAQVYRVSAVGEDASGHQWTRPVAVNAQTPRGPEGVQGEAVHSDSRRHRESAQHFRGHGLDHQHTRLGWDEVDVKRKCKCEGLVYPEEEAEQKGEAGQPLSQGTLPINGEDPDAPRREHHAAADAQNPQACQRAEHQALE